MLKKAEPKTAPSRSDWTKRHEEMRKRFEEGRKQFMEKHDKNKDGKIDADEWKDVRAEWAKRRQR